MNPRTIALLGERRIRERREEIRRSADEHVTEHHRLIEDNARLLEENLLLRAAVAKAAHTIETSMTASAQGTPHGADGRRRDEPVRSESTETTS